MTDIYDKAKRSAIMSKISGKETKPEILVRKFLHTNGFRFRKNDKRYPGKPDVILPKFKTIIFIHGCFWHGHLCKAGKLPETRKEFWTEKLQANKARDNQNIQELKKLGWKVLVIWQCEIKNKSVRSERLESLLEEIGGHGK